jgi:hypothetical protein
VEYLLSFLYLFLILIFIKKSKFFKNTNLKSASLYLLFFIKLIAAYCLFLVYTRYYTDRSTADIFKYFDDSTWLFKNVFSKSPVNYFKIILGIHTDQPYIHYELKQTQYWFKPHETNVFNDNRTVIRFNLIIYLISLGYYHIHTLILCFLSFVGLTGIYKTFHKLFPQKTLILILCIYFLPSVLFWGSGILKESILLFSVGIFIYKLSEIVIHQNKSILNYLIITVAFLLLTITKPYVILTLTPSIIALLTYHYFKNIRILTYYIFVHFFCIVIALMINHYNSNLDVLGNIVYKQHDFLNVARDTHANSTIYVEKLSNNIYSFIHFSPLAFVNGFFRPTILELNSISYLPAILESTILIFGFCLFLFKKKIPLDINQRLIIYFSLFFSMFLALLIGLATPVLGAIVRYRVPYLPFLYSAIFLTIPIPEFSIIKKIENKLCK